MSKKGYLLVDDYARIQEKQRSLYEEAGLWKIHQLELGMIASSIDMIFEGKKVLKDSTLPRTYFSLFQKRIGPINV